MKEPKAQQTVEQRVGQHDGDGAYRDQRVRSLAPPSSSKNNARRARRQRRSLIIAFAVIGAVVGALLLLWAALRVVRYIRKKAALEADRAMQRAAAARPRPVRPGRRRGRVNHIGPSFPFPSRLTSSAVTEYRSSCTY